MRDAVASIVITDSRNYNCNYNKNIIIILIIFSI